jgi:hypothetical protein
MGETQPVICEGTCTVVLTVADPLLDEEKIADYNTLFWAFLLVAVTVWGLKRMLKLFTDDHEG